MSQDIHVGERAFEHLVLVEVCDILFFKFFLIAKVEVSFFDICVLIFKVGPCLLLFGHVVWVLIDFAELELVVWAFVLIKNVTV